MISVFEPVVLTKGFGAMFEAAPQLFHRIVLLDPIVLGGVDTMFGEAKCMRSTLKGLAGGLAENNQVPVVL